MLLRFQFILQLSGTCRQIGWILCFQFVGNLFQKRILFRQQFENSAACYCFNSSYTGSHGGLGHNLEQTDFTGIRTVRAAA